MPVRKREVEHSAADQAGKEDVQTSKPQPNGHPSPKEFVGAVKDDVQSIESNDTSNTPVASGATSG